MARHEKLTYRFVVEYRVSMHGINPESPTERTVRRFAMKAEGKR